MSAITGWLALAGSIVIALIGVFYNALFYGNIIPLIAGQVYGTFGDGGGVPAFAQGPTLGPMSMWGRVVIIGFVLVAGGLYWYREVIVYGRSDQEQ